MLVNIPAPWSIWVMVIAPQVFAAAVFIPVFIPPFQAVKVRWRIGSITLMISMRLWKMRFPSHVPCWNFTNSPHKIHLKSMKKSSRKMHNWLVVGPPLWKIWVRQLGWVFPIYGKIKFMFQTTNQIKTTVSSVSSPRFFYGESGERSDISTSPLRSSSDLGFDPWAETLPSLNVNGALQENGIHPIKKKEGVFF